MTFGLKYKRVTLISWGARHYLFSDVHAECAHQFLAHTLSACISFCDAHAQCTHQFLTSMISMFQAFLNFEFLCWALSWFVCSYYASVHDAYAQQKRRHVPDPYAQGSSSWCICSACFEGTVVCARSSTCHISSAHTPVPDLYAQRMHKMLQFLMRMLSARISSLPACQDIATGSFFLQLGMKALDF